MYLYANNLYGWAISQNLPTVGFKWISEKKINKLNLSKYIEDSKKGLILEADLEYSQELHNSYNDFPLAAEKIQCNKKHAIKLL